MIKMAYRPTSPCSDHHHHHEFHLKPNPENKIKTKKQNKTKKKTFIPQSTKAYNIEVAHFIIIKVSHTRVIDHHYYYHHHHHRNYAKTFSFNFSLSQFFFFLDLFARKSQEKNRFFFSYL